MAVIILLMTKGDKTTEFSGISTFTQLAQRPAHRAELCGLLLTSALPLSCMAITPGAAGM